jgi:hypothetical protein
VVMLKPVVVVEQAKLHSVTLLLAKPIVISPSLELSSLIELSSLAWAHLHP